MKPVLITTCLGLVCCLSALSHPVEADEGRRQEFGFEQVTTRGPKRGRKETLFGETRSSVLALSSDARSPERSFLFLVAMPFAPSSFLVPSSVLVTTSKALVTRSDALVTSSFLFLVVWPGAPNVASLLVGSPKGDALHSLRGFLSLGMSVAIGASSVSLISETVVSAGVSCRLSAPEYQT